MYCFAINTKNPGVFAEIDLQGIAENLKKYTERTTKIEMVPWLKTQTEEIQDMYSEVTLKIPENKLSRNEQAVITDYS